MSDATFATATALVLEGQCPKCETPLQRRDGYGACMRCREGWAVQTHRHTERCAVGCVFEDGEMLLTWHTVVW